MLKFKGRLKINSTFDFLDIALTTYLPYPVDETHILCPHKEYDLD